MRSVEEGQENIRRKSYFFGMVQGSGFTVQKLKEKLIQGF